MSSQNRSRVRAFLSEPLLHFLALGALVFLLFFVVSDPAKDEAAGQTLVVTSEEAEQLVVGFRQTWRRPPTQQELQALLANHVREEILVREAQGLSLDANDPIIRRRLAQKMEFLIDSAAGAAAPTEEELKAFFDETKAVFATAPRLALQQVFLGVNPSQEKVADVLAALKSGEATEQLGEPSLLPTGLRLSARPAVDGTFGTGFFAALSDGPVNVWFGPVRSGFGVHAVRVFEREEGGVPPLDEIRDQVETAWRTTQTEAVAEEFFARLEEGYLVQLPPEDQLQGLLE
ncbi:MAG: peptidylprolyl isomerase [Dinoroseobacter sp.]|nr:peptidylprolyl isomerase [Dinoroseobacter sp.]